ncbi:hypothetical protein M8494_25840 [Serratia ureilytica]
MDHVQGLFPLRWGCGNSILVYGPPDEQGCDDLFKHPGILGFSRRWRPSPPSRTGRHAHHPAAAATLQTDPRLSDPGGRCAGLPGPTPSACRRPPPTHLQNGAGSAGARLQPAAAAAGAEQPQRPDPRAGDAAVAAAQTHAVDAHQPSSRSHQAAGQRTARRAELAFDHLSVSLGSSAADPTPAP